MPAFSSIASGVGALGSLAGGISGFFGGGQDTSGQEEAIQRAAQLQASAAERAQNFQEQELQNARNYMRPYVDMGTNALGLYGGLLNVPGYAPQDPTATLRATPGYDWMMSQGVNALDRSAAAKGMLQSGPQAKALTAYGQGLGDQTYQQYLNRLQNMVASGQNAANLQGSYGMAAAPTVGNFLTQGAQAQGQGIVGAQMARQSGYGQGMNNLMGGIGAGLGFLNMMPQSGQNWLGNLWGNGGGGNSLGSYNAGYYGSPSYSGQTPAGYPEYNWNY